MQVSYHKEDSRHLGRPMEFKRYGHAGRPALVFPTSKGRFYQFEDTGSVAALAGFIDAGQVQLFAVDGIDEESFFASGIDNAARIARHEAYFAYVRDEALPLVQALAGKGAPQPMVMGCSMGAYHSANFLFRFPELVSGIIALSGVYSTRDFFGGALDGAIYFNSPLDYLRGLEDERVLNRLRQLRLAFCCGRGAWEERMVRETHELEAILIDKRIPAWVDFWGSDVSHDWPWWHKQLVYFMDWWLREDQLRRSA
jgi:esterase/lipase superfamily enzyme